MKKELKSTGKIDNLFEIKWIKAGQQRRYGPSKYVAEIHTSAEFTDDEIKDILNEPKSRLPKHIWLQRTGIMGEYFKGWYTVTKTDYGYLYQGEYPYDD